MKKTNISNTSESIQNKHKIWRFALIWQQMYQNHASIPGYFFENMEFLGEEFAELGFEMDCGASVGEAYPNLNLSQLETWSRVLPQIDDVQLLGNAIYSQWRYWNHWSMAPMEANDYQWFVLAFGRLAELSE